MNREELIKLAEELKLEEYYDRKYSYYGVRVETPNWYTDETKELPNVGEIVEYRSYIWDDGDSTGEQLNGLSTVEVIDGDLVKAVEYAKSNYTAGTKIMLLGSDAASYGEDKFEIILEQPEVIAIID
jgi:hypothetical protein